MKKARQSLAQRKLPCPSGLGGRGGSRLGNDVDSGAAFIKRDPACFERKERPIPSGAYVVTCREFGAALTHQDASGCNNFTSKMLHSKPFADAVASITNAALSFFVCHK
jgi:hypothetical protein